MNEMQLSDENKRLKYDNAKLLKINEALMQRVEEGGNQSAPYAAFEHSVHLAEQVREKTQTLGETLSQLERRNRQLKTFQQRFTDAIESLSEAFVLLDCDGQIILQNSNFEAFLQTSNLPSETVLNLKALTEKKDHQKNTNNDGQLLKPVFQLSDGRWFQLNERPTVEGGRVLLYTDISALKKAETVRYEQAMAQKSVQLHSLVDNLSQGVVLLSSEKQIEVWNSRFVQLSQLATQQLHANIGLRDLQALTELELPTHPRLGSDFYVQTLQGGTVLEIRVHQLHDGKTIITYTDITERHRNQQSLQENERRLRLITDNVPAMIAYIGADLKFEFTNQVYIDWYGSTSRGLDITELDKSLNYKQIKPFVQRALKGESVIFESRELNRTGEPNYLLKSYVPNLDGNGVVLGFFVLIRNITERRINALALQKAHDQLERRVVERTSQLSSLNQKLLNEVEERRRVQTDLQAATREAEQANFSKTKFLAAVSHDLLQPLNAAQLFTSSIVEKTVDAQLAPLINSVSSSLDDLENLICTLVDISKLDAGVVKADKCNFKLSDLLDNLAREYQQQSGLYGVQLRYVSCDSLVHSDSFLLARILRNFLSNAFRYTDKGKVLLGCRRVDNKLCIEVWDNGAGIAQDQQTEIFKEFKRLKSSRSAFTNGLGLGLAIVDKISKVLEHPVKVSSTLGKGSLFSVTVPLADKTDLPQPAAQLNQALTKTELAGRTVWLVDNDFNICAAMKQLLETWDCTIITAASLADLQAQVDIGNDHANILIVDYHLDDGINGLDVAEQINHLRSTPLPVLMITANYNKSLQKEIKEHGLLLLHKPVRAIKLKTTMLYLLNKK
ncbi:fused PAS, GGDEF domain sensor protein and response regulator [Psychromonas ingrahamii 37]|uniref:histidine kinase n=1 Tax=Psychromonas ingrahamii (strain DSM 17664 / CCUG 51855 / 37) TaxID=357804 RepID=A1SXP3_PSYIN|nr:NahK/ErcS family hybrid sensor histidine kinase/response regulator [Psychromonas ingrahamii]ABM04258.1 fused PAS, GGDEF domain sensor protein and response regulator [Psychromonas ingrahamii 37]